jgi:hypothetical protein
MALSRQEFLIKSKRIAQQAVGKNLKIKTSAGAIREGIITRIEFHDMIRVSPCYVKCLFKAYQEIPKLDGTGTVERYVLVTLEQLPNNAS